MSEDQQISVLFEKFSAKFEETIFTLIAKFNEIHDGFSRVQEALDFLGKLQIQTSENKQLLTAVDKSYKNLERKLRDMSADGFTIPGGSEIMEKVAESANDLGSLLNAPAKKTPKAEEVKEEIKDMGDISKLPPLESVIEKPQKTRSKTAPELKLEVKPSPAAEIVTNQVTEPKVEPAINQEPASKPLPKAEPVLTPLPQATVKSELNLTPLPKFEQKSVIAPSSEIPKSKPEPPKTLPQKSEPESGTKKGLTPMPTPPKAITEPTLINAPKGELGAIAQQKIADLKGPLDIWNNLEVDVKNSQTNEEIALALGFANDTLKSFVRFHKVLFEILKTASDYRKRGPNVIPTDEEKAQIIKKIASWKLDLR